MSSPVRMSGPRAAFPRKGAWAKTPDGQLGIIFEIKDVKVEDPASTETNPLDMMSVKQAVVHIINSDRSTKMKKIQINGEDRMVADDVVCSPDELTQPTYSEIQPYLNEHEPSNMHSLGYSLDDDQLKSLTALQRMQIGKSFNDEDKAQALIEQSEQELESRKRQRVAQHPEAIKLEEEIEKERQAFVASVEARRQEMFDKLTKNK